MKGDGHGHSPPPLSKMFHSEVVPKKTDLEHPAFVANVSVRHYTFRRSVFVSATIFSLHVGVCHFFLTFACSLFLSLFFSDFLYTYSSVSFLYSYRNTDISLLK